MSPTPKTVKAKATRTWKLQAYLAVSPRHPKWCNVTMDAVEGWQTYHYWKGQKLIRDPRLSASASGWTFVSAKAGESVLRELMDRPQSNFLRVIERQTVITEQAIAGFDIEDGTIVRKTDGTYPAFGLKLVDGCVDAMPELLK